MREIPRFYQMGTLYFVLLFTAAGTLELKGQTASRTTPTRPAAPEEISQAELQEAYRTMREQLRATQAAIVNNRVETDASARVQATAIAEKIDGMNATLAAERKTRQAENDRFEFVHDQQQAEIRRSNRSVIWVASIFGSIGLMAMVFAAFFQWRAINRMAEVVNQRPLLDAPAEHGLLPAIRSSPPPALSTQRLLSAIDRMEQRIKELEHTAIAPAISSTPPQPPRQAQAQEIIV